MEGSEGCLGSNLETGPKVRMNTKRSTWSKAFQEKEREEIVIETVICALQSHVTETKASEK